MTAPASALPRATVGTAITVTDLSLGVIGGDLILEGVGFQLHPGRILALVGESGSGKTTAALACMNHLRAGLEVRGGRVELHEGASRFYRQRTDLLRLSEKQVRRLRGGTIAYVPQDPALSLNGALTVGEQIHEVLRIHEFGDHAREREARVEQVLEEVGLPPTRDYQRRYPHQLSGGQQQRIGLAMAFACRPAVIILDEPTTGLDVATQDLVLETVHQLAAKHDVAGLYITHDLAVVAKVAADVAVMLRGRIVETGPAQRVLQHPGHDYTKALLAAVPDLGGIRTMGGGPAVSPPAAVRAPWDRGSERTGRYTVTDREPAASTAQRRVVEQKRASEQRRRQRGDEPLVAVRELRLSYGPAVVLDGIHLDLLEGETTMLLGESGSGKTTLSRAIAGLNGGYSGEVRLDGELLARRTRERSNEARRRIQYVFQSPFSSLNPRRSIGESIAVPLEMTGGLGRAQRRSRVAEALDSVRLGRSYIDRRPGELSGGERQRAAVARALVNTPSVLVCDEITSALDVSVQAQVIELLRELQRERGLAMLFVTHNIALARHVSHRLAVLEKGRLVDHGTTDHVLRHPRHGYTRSLLEHVPTL